MSQVCSFEDEERVGCTVCGKRVYATQAIVAGDNDELCCSEDCAHVVAHEPCREEPCADCMDRAQYNELNAQEGR